MQQRETTLGIGPADRKKLWGRSRNQCAFTSCLQALVDVLPGDGQTDGSVIGEEAHIRSKSPDGPRYDPHYDPALLDSYENFLLLCPTHHTMIDKENGRGFSAKALVDMRNNHERQLQRSAYLDGTMRAFLAYQYEVDDRVRFEAVDINGLELESLFVDVPVAWRIRATGGDFLVRLQRERPGDLASLQLPGEFAAAGAAQALLHPDWRGHALLVGGPGQGKSTLLKFLCQYHRARILQRDQYTGATQHLNPITDMTRVAIRIDLKHYASWLPTMSKKPGKSDQRRTRHAYESEHASIEQYIVHQIATHSGGQHFEMRDLATVLATRPVLLALDSLDEVANLTDRERVADAIADTSARLSETAADLVILVASRPGSTSGRLWSSSAFPKLTLQRLTTGLRVQYLQAWAKQAGLAVDRADRLQRILLKHEELPHIRELASNPMQLAILLHLLHRRQLLPQQRTELYDHYISTFFDREDDKEPLVQTERAIVEDIHAYLAWHLQCHTEIGDAAGSIGLGAMNSLLHDYLRDHERGLQLAERLFTSFTTRMMCLVINESDDVEFEVQSLREYFAARFIKEHAPVRGDAGNTRDDCINALLERPYWSNVLRFLVGMLSLGEIRGIPSNLRSLLQRGMRELPHVRWMAAQLLDDRVFGALDAGPVQEMVDVALDGPGVVLAEDGLLDASGTPVTMSDDAGRAQARRHLQRRLGRETDPVLRGLIARGLKRHAEAAELRDWWWSNEIREVSAAWLRTAADLGVLTHLTAGDAEHVAACAPLLAGSQELLLSLLIRGGCDCRLDTILGPCLVDCGDGLDTSRAAVDSGESSLGRVLYAACLAANLGNAEVGLTADLAKRSARKRTRERSSEQQLLGTIEGAITGTLARTNDWTDAASWVRALDDISTIWGDSWMLRRAVFNVRDTVHLATDQADISFGSHWRKQLAWIQLAVDHRGNSAWWTAERPDHKDSLTLRLWALALIAYARSTVVAVLAADLDHALAAMPPRHIVSIEAALVQHAWHGGRRLGLDDDLRLRRLSVSGRAAALLSVVAHDSTRKQLTRAINAELPTLLRDGLADLRAVRKLDNITIKIDTLRGVRSYRLDSLLEVSRLTGLNDAQARTILSAPHDWPATIVQAASQRLSQKSAQARDVLVVIAAKKNWFPGASWRPRR